MERPGRRARGRTGKEDGLRPKKCTGEGGAEIVYRVADDAGEGAPALVLAGGLGGTHLVWTALTRGLRDRHRIVLWDYPGLTSGGSLPEDAPVDIAALARDQAAVLDAVGVERAVAVGWSLGTQVAVEFARLAPGRCRALVAICGVDGRPFLDDPEDEPIAAALGLREAVPGAVGWLSRRIERIERLKAMLRRIERPTRWAKRLGFVDPLVDELVFDAVTRDFIDLDPSTYRRYVEAAAAHDASDACGDLHLPVLAVAGERDRLLLPSRVEEMARAIPGAEYLAVRGATHFLPLEYPDTLTAEIEDFLRRRLDR